jgi:hypothetical protein
MSYEELEDVSEELWLLEGRSFDHFGIFSGPDVLVGDRLLNLIC